MKAHALVVPMDSGHRGWRMGAGPERLMAAGVIPGAKAAKKPNLFEPAGTRGEVGSAVEIAGWLSERVAAVRDDNCLPLVFAGNCISSLGTIAGCVSSTGRVPGVCWLDAHADFNTPETTPSGFLDGMALATLTGRCWTALMRSIPGFVPVAEPRALLIGARELDPAEEAFLQRSAVARVGARESAAKTTQTLEQLRSRTEELYLHIDLDVLDVSVARVNQYACGGGVTRERLVELAGEIRRTFKVCAAALTAYDPAFDKEDRVPDIAREVIETILG